MKFECLILISLEAIKLYANHNDFICVPFRCEIDVHNQVSSIYVPKLAFLFIPARLWISNSSIWISLDTTRYIYFSVHLDTCGCIPRYYIWFTCLFYINSLHLHSFSISMKRLEVFSGSWLEEDHLRCARQQSKVLVVENTLITWRAKCLYKYNCYRYFTQVRSNVWCKDFRDFIKLFQQLNWLLKHLTSETVYVSYLPVCMNKQ